MAAHLYPYETPTRVVGYRLNTSVSDRYPYGGGDPIYYRDPYGKSILPGGIIFGGPVAVGGFWIGCSLGFFKQGKDRLWDNPVKGYDKYIHCMTACNISQSCGVPRDFVLILGELKEQIDRLPGGNGWDIGDLAANWHGVNCPGDCHKGCSEKYPIGKQKPW